jgi:tRNA uridine 5-carboxymethylaminomethyl modification enzyme
LLNINLLNEGLNYFKSLFIPPGEVNHLLRKFNSSEIAQSENAAQILKRNEISLKDFINLKFFDGENLIGQIRKNNSVMNQIEIELKYEGYIKRQNDDVNKFNAGEEETIPVNFDFSKIKSLSKEAIEKLNKVKPNSLGQASRIAGVTPSDISILSIYMKG